MVWVGEGSGTTGNERERVQRLRSPACRGTSDDETMTVLG